jgi:hypothetical protein
VRDVEPLATCTEELCCSQTGSSDSNNSETIDSTANTLILARESMPDPDIITRLVNVFYPLLLAVYENMVDPNVGSLNADQLAMIDAFNRTSAKTWDNVSLEAWSVRLHLYLQGNSLSDPLDPRAEISNMLCEASTSNNNTNGMLVLSNSVCMIQKCGITPNACLRSSARGSLEDTEVLIDEDGGDDEGGGLPRREFVEVVYVHLSEFKRFSDTPIQDFFRDAEAPKKGNGVMPNLFTVIDGIVRNKILLLEFHYFNVSPHVFLISRAHGLAGWGAWVAGYYIGRYAPQWNWCQPIAECSCVVVYDLRYYLAAAQYRTAVGTGESARDPDLFAVIHIHFSDPCNVWMRGQRIQVKCAVPS